MARKNYMMTQAQYDKLLAACQPVAAIALHCGPPPTQAQLVDAAWDALGREMGFVGRSAAPGEYGRLSFTAEPTAPAPSLLEAAQALGAMPEGYCFCSSDRIGDDSKAHEPECADLRAAITKATTPE